MPIGGFFNWSKLTPCDNTENDKALAQIVEIKMKSGPSLIIYNIDIFI